MRVDISDSAVHPFRMATFDLATIYSLAAILFGGFVLVLSRAVYAEGVALGVRRTRAGIWLSLLTVAVGLVGLSS